MNLLQVLAEVVSLVQESVCDILETAEMITTVSNISNPPTHPSVNKQETIASVESPAKQGSSVSLVQESPSF